MNSFLKRLTSHFTGNAPSKTSDVQTPKDTVGTRCRASETRNSEKTPLPNNEVNHPKASPSPWGEGRGEGELNNSRRQPAPDNSNFKTQPSTFDDLNFNRNGKIAHLPRELRDRINLALYNRCTAKDLARALNQMPEVQSVMAQYFDGRPLRQQNISEWKLGGYRDWLHHRQILEQKRELASDAKDLSDAAKGTAESLFGILTLNYTHLLMNRNNETPEEFEKKRKELSLVSQDISRMHRCHINTRRVEVQEARLDRDEEKTTEQLHFKFMEWAENPAIRRACILEPMEANRQTRQHFGMPPTSDDILVEQLTKDDPYFNPPNKKPAKNRPLPAEKSPDSRSSGRESAPTSEPQKGSSSQPGVGTTVPTPGSRPDDPINPEGVESKPSDSSSGAEGEPSQPSNPYEGKTTSQIIAEIEEEHAREKASRLNPSDSKIASSPPHSPEPSDTKTERGAHASRALTREASANSHVVLESGSASPPNTPTPNSKLKTQNSTLSDYDRALLAGKTHLEAIEAQFTPAAPGSQPAPRPQGSSAWDSFSQPVRYSPYARLSPHPDSSFKLSFG